MTENKTEFFRPQVDRSLQRPLLILGIRLGRKISDVASEAIRQYIEAYLEGLVDEPEGNNQTIVDNATLKVALRILKTGVKT